MYISNHALILVYLIIQLIYYGNLTVSKQADINKPRKNIFHLVEFSSQYVRKFQQFPSRMEWSSDEAIKLDKRN